jgi:excisionase family DNA binding protein
MATTTEGGPVGATEDERPALEAIARLLEGALRDPAGGMPRLVGARGEAVALPESVCRVLRRAVRQLAQGRVVTVLPLDAELTTQQAADLLAVSRPHFVKLLEGGAIPFVRTGTHRRVRFRDVMEYRERRDAARQRALAELTQLSEEAGLYAEEGQQRDARPGAPAPLSPP